MAEGIGPVKVNNWHQALSDLMIKCPEMRAYEVAQFFGVTEAWLSTCLLYTSPSPRDRTRSRMPSSA